MNRVDVTGNAPDFVRVLNAAKWLLPQASVSKLFGQAYAGLAIAQGGSLSFDWEKMIFVVRDSPLVDWHMDEPGGGFTPSGDLVCLGTGAKADILEHEYQHVKQADAFLFTAFYLDAHARAQAYSYLTSGSYSKNNPLEKGPYSTPPRPWPW